MEQSTPKIDARSRLLNEAIRVVRERGWAATSVDAICEAAGVTKGAFFYHFPNKEALGVAAAKKWGEGAAAMFSAGDWRNHPAASGRVLGYVELRRDMIAGEAGEWSCFAGTVVQEVHATSPLLATAAGDAILVGASVIEADILEALEQCGRPSGETAHSLALYVQAVIQGAIIMAKATGDQNVAGDNLNHLRSYLEQVLKKEPKQ